MFRISLTILTFVGVVVGTAMSVNGQTDALSVVAFERFTAPSTGGNAVDDRRLISFSQDPPPGSYTESGDGFQEYQLGLGIPIPRALLDESYSLNIFDDLGIVDASSDSPGYKSDAWFGAIDTINCDNTSTSNRCPDVPPDGARGDATADWIFDVSGASDLRVSVDMAAMGDFENFLQLHDGVTGDTFTVFQDRFDWFYSMDDGPMEPLFTSSIDESAFQSYSLAGAFVRNVADPALVVNTEGVSTKLNNSFHRVSSSIPESGGELTVRLVAELDGDSEIFAFDNIVIEGLIGVTPEMIPGDYNNDSVVEASDLNLVLFNWSAIGDTLPESWIKQRPSGGLVGVDELNRVLFNWGRSLSVPLPISPATLAPEPSAAVILVQAMLLTMFASTRGRAKTHRKRLTH